MISQEGAPSLKASFQITRIPLDEITTNSGGHGLGDTRRFLHSLQVEEENKTTDFRYFSRIPFEELGPCFIS